MSFGPDSANINSMILKKKRHQFIVSGVSGFQVRWQINPHMKIGATCLDIAESQHQDFVQTLVTCGADVFEVPFIPGAYDSVFMKDGALVIDKNDGRAAFLTKPYHRERRSEPLIRAFDLQSLGVQIEDESHEYLEGGDVIIHAHKSMVFMGHGFRTSAKAKQKLQTFLNCDITRLKLKDPYFYHLDTAMNITCMNGKCLVFAYPGAFTKKSWHKLCQHPGIDQIIKVSRQEAMQFALNWVEINDTVILGNDVPKTQSALKEIGKKVLIRPLSQFQLAGGSAACLVAPVHDFS